MTEDHGIEYGKIFGSWQIRELIGKGSRERTRVYRITRNSHGILEEERALKTVTVCEAARLDKMTARARAEYDANRKVLCEKACNEVLLMNRLEGEPHIVGYLDWELRDRTGGTDLLIAMHLLETLETLQDTKDDFCEADVLQVGMDICQALIPCQKEGIVHRDIKPANIFRRPDGKGGYLLGDFGISRIVEAGMGASTRIGTPAYAAPEQVRMGGYDSRVDIYSLGIVLYELSNRNCLPFASSRYCAEEAVNRRVLYGEPLPAPSGAGPALASVILKACAFRPEERFQTAQEFLDALEKIRYGQPAGLLAGVTESAGGTDPYATMPLAVFSQDKPPAEVLAVSKKAVWWEGSVEGRARTLDARKAEDLFSEVILNDNIDLLIPEGYTTLDSSAFVEIHDKGGYLIIDRIKLPQTMRAICGGAFDGVVVSDYIEIPASVFIINDLPYLGPDAYVRCGPGTAAHIYCRKNHVRNSVDDNIS